MTDVIVMHTGLEYFFLPALLFGVAFTALGILWLILFFPLLLIWLWILARICRKAGFTGWWCLTTFFPPLLAAMIWVLAFTEWPLGGPRIDVLPPRR
jgi:hypothetical protein